MLDDRDDDVLGVLRVYDRHEVERYLAAVEGEAAELERRLDAAQARRAQAEHQVIAASYEAGRASTASDEMRQALAELQQVEEEHAATVEQIRVAAIADARQILTAAEREVLVLRAALQGVLDELETGHHADPGTPFLALAPELDEVREDDHRQHPSFGTVSQLRPEAPADEQRRLHSVATGPSLAG